MPFDFFFSSQTSASCAHNKTDSRIFTSIYSFLESKNFINVKSDFRFNTQTYSKIMKIFLHKMRGWSMKQIIKKFVFENLLSLLRYRIFLSARLCWDTQYFNFCDFLFLVKQPRNSAKVSPQFCKVPLFFTILLRWLGGTGLSIAPVE